MAAYMKPVRTADVARAVPLDGRGQRSAQTMLSINEREALLRDAADRFCVGMSDRQAAAMLHAKLAQGRSLPKGPQRAAVSGATSRHHHGIPLEGSEGA
jgi:hypothetical protein